MYVKTVNVAHSGVGLYNIYYKQNVERFNNPFIVCVQCEGYNKSTNKTVQEVPGNETNTRNKVDS